MPLYLEKRVVYTGEPGMPPVYQGAPAPGYRGILDLSSSAESASTNPLTTGWCLWWYDTPQTGMFMDLGSNFRANLRATQKAGLEAALGLPPGAVVSDRLDNVLFELMFKRGDISGETKWPLIRGSASGGVSLQIAGQPIYSSGVMAAEELQSAIDMFRLNYERNRLTVPPAALQKWVGGEMLIRFGEASDDAADALMAPNRRADGWQRPTSTYTDDFNRADGDIGADWDQTENGHAVASNAIVNDANNGSNNSTYTANAMGADDFTASLTTTNSANNYYGPGVRANNDSSTNGYLAMIHGTTLLKVWERTTGGFVEKASDSITYANAKVVSCEATSGGLIKSFFDGTEYASFSENMHAGNLYGHMHMNTNISSTNYADDFTIDDGLGGGATTRRYSLTLTGVG